MPAGKTPERRFSPGDAVRVKAGLTDPDYPDMPIGGWSGRIAAVEPGDPPTYLVRWNRETLQNMHPVYRNRCERDGLECDEMWLAVDDLETDADQPAQMEQPARISTKPLDMMDQEDRIRAVFGLTHDDPLPDATLDSLKRYHRWLTEHLSLPFKALWQPESRRFGSRAKKVTVISLGSPEQIDETTGLMCAISTRWASGEAPLAELEIERGDPARQSVGDYRYWFWNWLA